MAVDHRIRCAFVRPGVHSAVLLGVQQAGEVAGPVASALGADLVEALVAHGNREWPCRRGRGWMLAPEPEERLDRLCYAAAWFERVFRDGAVLRGSPLETAEQLSGLEELLAVVPEYAVRDIQVLTRLGEEALGSRRDACAPGQCWSGPSFAGSADVGGADADLLVGGTLLEIKTKTRPAFLPDSAIWQLAGYLLLDYDDTYEIREVGIYAARIGWLATWQVDEFLDVLGARQSLNDLRRAFAERASSANAGLPDEVGGQGDAGH